MLNHNLSQDDTLNTLVPGFNRLLVLSIISLLFLLFLSSTVLLSASAGGVVYYVDALWGNDTRTLAEAQNPATPWKSISHAAAMVPAGDVGNANIIQVNSGTYSALRTGEIFPIRFQNENVTIRGAGAGESAIDANLREPLILVLDAPNITVEDFEIRNSTLSLISSTIGGFNVQNNVLLHSIFGVAVSAHITTSVDTEIGSFRVAENTIDVNGSAIQIDVGLLGEGAAVNLNIGSIDILTNTIILPEHNGLGIDFDDFYLEDVNGGSATIGAVTIRNNIVDGGRFGIDMYGWIDDMTDAVVAIGDVEITGNRLQDQNVFSVFFDYYDLDFWDGASSGKLGDVVIENNQISSDQSDGFVLEDFGYMFDFSEGSRATAGEVRIADNIVNTPGGQAISFKISDIKELEGSSAITVSNISLTGNVVTGTTGIIVELYSIESIYDDSSYNIGSIMLAGNTIDSIDGIFLEMYSVGVDMDGSAFGLSGPITVTDNTIWATSGAITFAINDIAGWLSDQAAVEMGDIAIQRNTISGEGDNLILYPSNYVAYENRGNARVELPGWSVQDNHLFGAGMGVEFDAGQNPMENEGNVRIDWGGLDISRNLMDGTSGILVDLEDFGSFNKEGTFVYLESINVDDNTILNTNGDILQLGLANYGQFYDCATTTEVGDISISGNTFSSATGSGLLFDLAPLKGAYDATVIWGDWAVNDNDFQNIIGNAFVIDMEAQIGDNSRIEIGKRQIDGNNISECGGGLVVSEIVNQTGLGSLQVGDLSIDRNSIQNSLLGMNLRPASGISVTNNILGSNINGGIVLNVQNNGWLVHNTIASSQLETSDAIWITGGTAAITNTIISNYYVGIHNVGGQASQDYILFNGNGLDLSGVVSGGANSLNGTPAFKDQAAGDFHLTAFSDAIDRGLDLGVNLDIDGDIRSTPPDIGADEFTGTLFQVFLPLVMSDF